jgi:hypothetical protein
VECGFGLAKIHDEKAWEERAHVTKFAPDPVSAGAPAGQQRRAEGNRMASGAVSAAIGAPNACRAVRHCGQKATTRAVRSERLADHTQAGP